MSIEFNTGTLYMNDVPLCQINEIPTLTYEPAHESLTEAKQIFDVGMSFFSDITYFNTDLFEQLTASTTAPFKLCAEIPIMIQARWHKKPRIRKKWLKRYGMKPDVVKIEMDIDQLEYTPGEYINECETGIIGTYNSFNFNTNEIRYIFRPDQLRRGIKIEV